MGNPPLCEKIPANVGGGGFPGVEIWSISDDVIWAIWEDLSAPQARKFWGFWTVSALKTL